jgi:hypothetical protein
MKAGTVGDEWEGEGLTIADVPPRHPQQNVSVGPL